MTRSRGSYGEPPTRMDTLAERIRATRMYWGWTQKQLGEAINSSPKTVWHWEQGRQEPSDAAMGALALLFGMSVHVLRSGEGFILPEPPRQMGRMLVAENYANDMVVLPKVAPGGLCCIHKDQAKCDAVVSMAQLITAVQDAHAENRPVWVVIGPPAL